MTLSPENQELIRRLKYPVIIGAAFCAVLSPYFFRLGKKYLAIGGHGGERVTVGTQG